MSQYGEPWAEPRRDPGWRAQVSMDWYTWPITNSKGTAVIGAPGLDPVIAGRICDCVNACAGFNPAGIPKLIEAVGKIVQACHEAKAHGWEDHTNFTQTLETALEACYLTPPPDSVP